MDYLEYADQARTEKQNYKSHLRGNVSRGQSMYGSKAALEATGRGGTDKTGDMTETPRIHCPK